MKKNHRSQENNDPSNDPGLWKVEPGLAIGVFHLGMPRDEILQILEDKHLDSERLSGSNAIYVLDMDIKLNFRAQSPFYLQLIEVHDERARFGTLKILWDYPHNLFASIPSGGTLWFDDLSQLDRRLPKTASARIPTDEQLLNGGTLWMKELGLGFKLTCGRITTLYLCDPTELPKTGSGEFTGAQRHLSEKMQLASFRTPKVRTRPGERAVNIGLMLIALLVIAFFGRRAWEEKKRWDNASEVQAEVVAVWPAPPDPFPSRFHLSYQDQSGKSHEAVLGNDDVFGSPQVGEKVALWYLPDSPQTALGPIKFRDVAFDHFVPYLLGTIGVYFVLYLICSFVAYRFYYAPVGSRNSAT